MNTILKTGMLATVIMVAGACGSTVKDKNGLAEKQTELKNKKAQAEKLNAEITTLETNIAKLDTSAAKVEKAKLVAVSPLKKDNFVHYIDLQGRVDAQNISYVTPRGQGGQVKAIFVKKGDNVRKGQLLMKLDNALVNQNLETAKTQLSYAQDIYKRQKNLWDQNIGTEVQLITAKNSVDQAQHTIALLQEQLGFSNVYAEVNGVADDVSIRVGETFTGSPAAGIKLVNTSDLKVVTDIPENYVSKVKKGTPVVITFPDLNKNINATITLISQSIGITSRGFTAEAKLPANAGFKPNQVALIKIQDYAAANSLSIPVNTLQTDEKGKYVLVASNENGKMIARKRAISIGELYGDKIEVKDGLQEGDVLITGGFQSLYDGQLLTTQG